MDEKKANEPLLYIQQSHTKSPVATMQSHYMTPKKADNQDSMFKKHPFSRNYFEHKQYIHAEAENNNDTVNETTEDKEDDITYDSEQNASSEKTFKEMDLRERIYYFIRTSDHLPSMRAEVRTEEQNYRGKIIDFQDEVVYFRPGRRPRTAEIPFQDISDIRLIGF